MTGETTVLITRTPAAEEKSSWDILFEFLSIFSLATCRDKILIVFAALFTFAHGLCFLGIAMVLGKMTGPYVQHYIYGFRNGSGSAMDGISINGTNVTLLSMGEFIDLMNGHTITFIEIAGIIFFISFIQTCLWELTSENQCYHIRKRFTDQVLRQEMTWFKKHHVSQLSFILSDSVQKVREGTGHKLSMALQYVTICGVQVLFALATNWQLTMIFLTISPLPVVLAKFLNFGRLLAKRGETELAMYAAASKYLSNVLGNIRRVYVFGKESYEVDKYRQSLHAAASVAINKYIVQSIGVGVFIMLLFGSYAIAYRHACSLILNHSASLTDIYTVFFTVTIAVFALGQILPWITTIAAAQGGGVAVSKVLYLPDPEIDASRIDTKPHVLSSITGELKFSDVSFDYPDSHNSWAPKVLDGLNMEIKPKQVVGLIGTPASGIATIPELIIRFYDPTSGKITIDDNTNIRSLDVAWYRNRIAIVPKDPPLFLQGTIFENIVAGRRDITITKERVAEVAKLMHVDNTITALGKGYDTEVGITEWEMGSIDRTKVGLVRALVRNPTWLILDRCMETILEFEDVMKSIKNLRKDLVTIVIGNKTDTMKPVDIIHFFENGQVAESGSYDELMKKKGKFYEFFQFKNMALATAFMHEQDYSIIVPDADDATVAQIMEAARRMRQKYPGFWKMITLTTHTCVDWSFWILATLGCILTGMLLPMFAFYYADIFSEFGRGAAGFTIDSKFWVTMLIILSIVGGIGYWMRAVFVQSAGEFMILALRKLQLKSILARPMIWFEDKDHSPRSLASRISDGAAPIKEALDNRFSIAFSALVSVITAIIFALVMEWQFGFGLAIGVLAIVALVFLQIGFQRSHQRISVALLQHANMIFSEAASQLRSVQSLSQEPSIRQKYANLIYGNLIDSRKSCILFAFMHSLSEMIVYLMLGGAYFYGSVLVGSGSMEPISFFQLFLILVFCLVTFGHTISFVPDYSKAELACGRIMDLIEDDGTLEMSRLITVDIPKWPKVLPLKFENVTLYRDNLAQAAMLEGCTFEVPAGKMLSIMAGGPDAASILTLIIRFYDVNGGRVLIGGKNIQDYPLPELRGNIGYVPKDIDLFEGSITDNVKFGYRGPKVSEFEAKALVRKVLQDVGLEKFIGNLRDGYDTPVVKDSPILTRLIKIKLMIARAIIRDPMIILMDDPVSGLTKRETLDLVKLINIVKVGRTCIMTTDSPELAKASDLVGMFVVNKFNEFGTNDELAKNPNGLYQLLVNSEINIPSGSHDGGLIEYLPPGGHAVTDSIPQAN